MFGYFEHEPSDVVVSWQTRGEGAVCFPWLSVSSYFYSKADCPVSGCLYAISIIKGEERPLLHASQRDDTSPPASPRVESFFFPYSWLPLFFLQVFVMQTISALSYCLCVFGPMLAGWFTHCGAGKEWTDALRVHAVSFRVLLKLWVYLLLNVLRWLKWPVYVTLSVFVEVYPFLAPVGQKACVLQEEMAESGRPGWSSHMWDSTYCCRKF